jgi:hypothetical protein
MWISSGGRPGSRSGIGDALVSGIAGANLSGTTLTIYSNWNGPSSIDLGPVTADLFISLHPQDGHRDFDIGLADDPGQIYISDKNNPPTFCT